ncbi:MAG: ABC transporter ATP-binding protein [Cyanobacteria bacterium]|nr:ABC transporter ATP-binding protein [Cyanobacteriota bacterium]
MSDGAAIETAGLWKRYDEVDALRGLDLKVPTGSIFGFLGRNGAGKTTTIKILLGMARPDKGEARVFGISSSDSAAGPEIRRRTAFVSDEKDLYDYMTVGEIVAFTRSFYPKWRGDLEQQFLRKFDLAPGRAIKGLSRGMRTKLAMLLALCRGAGLLLLDEPTSGLDPAMAEEVLQSLVGHVATEGATMFFSSHQLAEVEQIADHVAIIDRGQTVVSGALDDLRSQYQRIQLVFDADAPEIRVHAPGTHRVQRKGRVVTILSSSGGAAVLDELRGYRPSSFDVSPVTLKDIFLESVRTED